jgi:large subunit ribosomal protein L22
MTAARPHVQSVAKFVRVSPRKARLVADHIRGRSVPEARTILAFTTRAAAREIEKVLRSAIANAESNPNLHWNGDDLTVAAVFVDEGPTLKRFRARARGRVNPIFKRTCHITIRVDQLEGVEAKPKAPKIEAAPKTKKTDSKPKAKKASKKKEAVAS